MFMPVRMVYCLIGVGSLFESFELGIRVATGSQVPPPIFTVQLHKGFLHNWGESIHYFPYLSFCQHFDIFSLFLINQDSYRTSVTDCTVGTVRRCLTRNIKELLRLPYCRSIGTYLDRFNKFYVLFMIQFKDCSAAFNKQQNQLTSFKIYASQSNDCFPYPGKIGSRPS